MADQRYKLVNTTKHGIGFKHANRVEENIPAGRFVTLTEDDILYEGYCMTKWLSTGELKCDDPAVYMLLNITNENAIVAMSNEEIETKFKLPLKQFTAWLDSVEDEACLSRIYDAAVNYDNLPLKKLELIEAKTGFSILDARKNKEK